MVVSSSLRDFCVTTVLLSSSRVDMTPIEGFSSEDRRVSYLLQWTEKARIQLIEAVIEVEEQMIARASTARWSTTGKRKVNTRFEYKWSTVANSLPIQYRGKIWNERKQMYYKYKCDRMFNSLLHAYRERVAGKSTQAARWALSEPVLKLLKKREDIVRQRCTETTGKSLIRSEISTGEGQQQSGNSSESSEGQFLSCSVEEADAGPLPLFHELESTEEYRSLSNYVETEVGSPFSQDRLRDINHHVDSSLGCESTANLSDPSCSANDQNLEDVGMPFVRPRVQTRAPSHKGERDSNPLKRRQASHHSQPPRFLRRNITSRAWKKKSKLALLVDIYAKETERNSISQEEAVERCNSGRRLRNASKDIFQSVNSALPTPASPSTSFSESSVSGNMKHNRLKVQARAQSKPRKRDPNLSAKPADEHIHFVMPLASRTPRF